MKPDNCNTISSDASWHLLMTAAVTATGSTGGYEHSALRAIPAAARFTGFGNCFFDKVIFIGNSKGYIEHNFSLFFYIPECDFPFASFLSIQSAPVVTDITNLFTTRSRLPRLIRWDKQLFIF